MSISASMDDPGIDQESLGRLERQSKKLQRTAEDNTPEGLFPYVLYLLSRPPAFPSGQKSEADMDKKRAEGLLRSLKMVRTLRTCLPLQCMFIFSNHSFICQQAV